MPFLKTNHIFVNRCLVNIFSHRPMQIRVDSAQKHKQSLMLDLPVVHLCVNLFQKHKMHGVNF